MIESARDKFMKTYEEIGQKLLQAVREMKAGQAARVTSVKLRARRITDSICVNLRNLRFHKPKPERS